MKDYDVSNIISDVRIAIDQNTNDTELSEFGDVDTLELADVVKSKIVDAAWMIESAAPVYMCADGVIASNPTVTKDQVYETDESYYAVVGIKDDFLRLVTFKMSDWTRPVSNPITTDDPDYAVQKSRVEGVRGNQERPVLVMIPSDDAPMTGNNGNVFEAYSTSYDSTASYRYVPIPKIKNDKISLCDRLYKAVVYATAYLTALAYNADTQAERLLSIARSLAEIDTGTYQPQIQQQIQPQQYVEPQVAEQQ